MKQFITFFLIFLLLIGCKSKQKNENNTALQGKIFGTTYHITYLNNTNYQKAIDSLFNLVNKSLSTYLPTSDISRINKNDTTVVVDDFFIEVFNKSKRIYKETNGYFDPTFGKVIDAYGFGSGKKTDNLTKEQINELMKFVGFDKVVLKGRKIYKKNPEIAFNVNAIAKGYGVDVIGRFFESKGIVNYLVEIGGEIRARGVSPKNKAWRIAIDDPNTDGSRSQSRYVSLNNESIAGSGNYRKFRVAKNGKKYVHTINPKTGLAQENSLLSASVIMKGDCADVDAYATAFMAMGLEKTKLFLQKHPELKVILLYLDKEGNIKDYTN